jgi:hypothetical protein
MYSIRGADERQIERVGRMRTWQNCLEGLRKTTKTLIRTASMPAKAQTEHLQATNQDCYTIPVHLAGPVLKIILEPVVVLNAILLSHDGVTTNGVWIGNWI